MVHGSGNGRRGLAPRLRRALRVAAASGAMALAAPAGAAFADDAPIPPINTPLGTITFDDGIITVTFTGAGPTSAGTPTIISVDPATGAVRMGPTARTVVLPVPGQPSTSTAATPSLVPVIAPGDIPGGDYEVTITGGSASVPGLAAGATGASSAGLGPAGPGLTSCGLAIAVVPDAPPSVTCAGGERSAFARGLIPVALGVAGGSLTPDGVATGTCGAAGAVGSPVSAACLPDPLAGGLPAAGGSGAWGPLGSPARLALGGCGTRGCGLGGPDGASGLDPLGLALGAFGRSGSGEAPAAGTAGPDRGAPGTLLASTGTPLVAGLAGLALLMVGGFLTWKRARD